MKTFLCLFFSDKIILFNNAHTTRLRGATQIFRGGAPHKESEPTSEITLPYTSAFHSRTQARPEHPSGTSRAHPLLSSLHVFTCMQSTHTHLCPQHLLLCHLGLYELEFEFESSGPTRKWTEGRSQVWGSEFTKSRYATWGFRRAISKPLCSGS